MLFIAICNIVLLCAILSSFLLIRLTFFFQQMRFKLDPKDDATKQACTHVFSLLCDSIAITWGKLTLKARQTVNLPKHLQWKIYRMKTGEASLNTGLIQSIKYVICMWLDHMLNSYLCMCLTNLSSCRWTIQRTRPTIRKWNSNRRQDLVAILHTARLL